MINYNILQPLNQISPINTQIIQTQPQEDDLSGLLKGVGGLLSKTFGTNPVQQANQALNSTLSTGQPNPLSNMLLPQTAMSPSLMQSNNPFLNRPNNTTIGGLIPTRSPIPSGLPESTNPMVTAPSENPLSWRYKPYSYQTGNQEAASAPLNATMNSIAGVESGGTANPYSLMSKPSRNGDQAYGKYQIMGSNIPAWSKEALGRELTKEEFLAHPEFQDKIASFRINNLLKQGHSPNDVASIWFTGRSLKEVNPNVKDIYGTTNKDYQNKFNAYYSKYNPSVAQNNEINTQLKPFVQSGVNMNINPQFKQVLPNVINDLRQMGYQPKIVSGARTEQEQAAIVKQGNSHTMHSQHLGGNAVDIVDSRYMWNEKKYGKELTQFAEDMNKVAEKYGLISGTKWKSYGPLGDYAHLQYQQGQDNASAQIAKN